LNFISVEILGRVCEPQEIPQTQIGAAIATENVEILLELPRLGKRLFDGGLDDPLLRPCPANVVVGVGQGPVIVVSQAADAKRIPSVQMLEAGLEMDREVLRGIVIGHVYGNVKVDPADGVDELDKTGRVESHVIIERDPQHILDGRLQRFDAMQIGRVDLRKSGRHGRRINERISRDRNNADVLIFCIIHDDHDDVGISATLITGGNQKSITIFFSLPAARGVRAQWVTLAVRLLIENVGALAVIGRFGRSGTKGFLDDVQGGRCGRERHNDD